MNNLPKVSVVTITYGHQDYILDTIKGVLMQKYDGPIEFIIANDNSPDNTDEVIQRFLRETEIPANIQIQYTKHEVNKGMMPNFIWALEQATGSYIALCEGDDYWIDPFKLQKQIHFLEMNQDVILSFTNRKISNEGVITNEPLVHREPNQTLFILEDLLIDAPTLTRVFRNDSRVMAELSKYDVGGADTFLLVSQAKYGKIKFFDDFTAVYRVHVGGVWSSLDEIAKVEFVILTYLNCILILDNVQLIRRLKTLIIYMMITLIQRRKYAKLSKLKLYIKDKEKCLPQGFVLRIKVLNFIYQINPGILFANKYMESFLWRIFKYK